MDGEAALGVLQVHVGAGVHEVLEAFPAPEKGRDRMKIKGEIKIGVN